MSNACEVCGKVSSEVTFNGSKGKYLCLNCMFGAGQYKTEKFRKQTEQKQQAQVQRTQQAQQVVHQAQQYRQEQIQRRQDRHEVTRVPVLVSLDVMVGGVKSEIFYPASLQNFSPGGVCIDWSHCQTCTGYTEGGVHPFCIFGQFAMNNPQGKELTIRVELANADQRIEFKGQVVYTMKKDDTEYLGICFTQISGETLQQLERLCLNM